MLDTATQNKKNMNNLECTIRGNKKSFLLELINRDYLFQVVESGEDFVLKNALCNRIITMKVIVTLGAIVVTTILGFILENENLILTPIVGAFIFIPYFVFTTEKKIVFHGKSKKYRAYNIFEISFEEIRFDKIHGMRIVLNKNKKHTKIKLKFVGRKKTLFGENLYDLESIPQLYKIKEGGYSSQIEIDEEVQKIIEIANTIKKISDDKLVILHS